MSHKPRLARDTTSTNSRWGGLRHVGLNSVPVQKFSSLAHWAYWRPGDKLIFRKSSVSTAHKPLAIVLWTFCILFLTSMQNSYPLYTALVIGLRLERFVALGTFVNALANSILGCFYSARTQRFASWVWPMVLRRLGNRWKWKGESCFCTKVLFVHVGIVGIAEMWFYLV